jgi:hypothetical protein
LRSSITEVEVFREDSTKGRRSFILWSSQVEKIEKRLSVLLSTGHKVIGLLCTLGSLWCN